MAEEYHLYKGFLFIEGHDGWQAYRTLSYIRMDLATYGPSTLTELQEHIDEDNEAGDITQREFEDIKRQAGTLLEVEFIPEELQAHVDFMEQRGFGAGTTTEQYRAVMALDGDILDSNTEDYCVLVLVKGHKWKVDYDGVVKLAD